MARVQRVDKRRAGENGQWHAPSTRLTSWDGSSGTLIESVFANQPTLKLVLASTTEQPSAMQLWASSGSAPSGLMSSRTAPSCMGVAGVARAGTEGKESGRGRR
eukprot:5959468-Prymnesium_polylepis.1